MRNYDENESDYFDKDGTLIDFDSFWLPVSYEAIREILKGAGKEEVSVEDVLSALGVANNTTAINGVLSYGTYAQMGQKIYQVLKGYDCQVTAEELIKMTIQAFHRHFHKGKIQPTCEHISEVLSKLKNEGIKLAVVTTDDPFVTKKCLKALAIERFFDEVYTDDGRLPAKPDPYCIYDFCKKAKVSTSEMVMVGDTLTDVSFAKNGGIRVIGVAKSENNKKILEKEADNVMPDISYLFDILE